MRVLVAMSGGVDSSVAAAVLVGRGHSVVGATLELWGGPADSGCCSVADVEDARRVAEQLGIAHHVFDYTEAFEASVVAPYVAAHVAGRTPNPCIACNREIKFGTLLERCRRLGFDALATGHHARVVRGMAGWELRRGRDEAKDQSYVLAGLGGEQLAGLVLPVGEMTKAEVREQAMAAGLRTAGKPDSQDVCFIRSDEGRRGFVAARAALHAGRVVEEGTGRVLGEVPAVELVTVGQRRGVGSGGGTAGRRYVVGVDVARREVRVGTAERARSDRVALGPVAWSGAARERGTRVLAQFSAHGQARRARWWPGRVELDAPAPLVAEGQTVALYDEGDPERVVGAATAGGAGATEAERAAAEAR